MPPGYKHIAPLGLNGLMNQGPGRCGFQPHRIGAIENSAYHSSLVLDFAAAQPNLRSDTLHSAGVQVLVPIVLYRHYAPLERKQSLPPAGAK